MSNPAPAPAPSTGSAAGRGNAQGVGTSLVSPTLNQINMNIQGDKVHLDALLDYEGLLTLEKKIAALKILLEVHTAANDTGDDD